MDSADTRNLIKMVIDDYLYLCYNKPCFGEVYDLTVAKYNKLLD